MVMFVEDQVRPSVIFLPCLVLVVSQLGSHPQVEQGEPFGDHKQLFFDFVRESPFLESNSERRRK